MNTLLLWLWLSSSFTANKLPPRQHSIRICTHHHQQLQLPVSKKQNVFEQKIFFYFHLMLSSGDGDYEPMEKGGRLNDKVSKLSLKSTFSMSRAVWHYIYLACVCHWHLWGQNSFGDVHKTANIQYYVVPEMFWNCKSRQNVHLVHYHIDECWTDQRFWEIVADDILRNYFSLSICPHFWPRTHQIDLIKLSCSQLIKKI